MGSKSRNRPKNLARKLLQIRNTLGLSQSQMLRRLDAADRVAAARISEYESGVREPSLWMLLAYGRVARVHVSLPGTFNFNRVKRKLAADLSEK
jgi:transcriptional regulator with XRE-family HTH domain